MVVDKNGDILSSKCDIICQQVNCRGVMGSGLAKQIREWFPEVYSGYLSYCVGKYPLDLLGSVNFIEVDVLNDKKYIFANIFGQLNYGRGGYRYTSYDAITEGFLKVKCYADEHGYSVAIPHNIGCGLGGGDWAIVRKIIEDIFENSDTICEIWKL